MADLNRQSFAGTRTGADVIDAGLRAYMLRVYNYMGAGLAITGVVAYLFYSMAVTGNPADAVAQIGNKGIMLTEFGRLIFVSPLKWVLLFAPLGVVFFLSARLPHMSLSAAQGTFWLYAALVGASLASIFLVYTGNSITQVFFVTAAAFGGLSLYGYTTKRDLSGWGSFLIMGVIGIVIAGLLNIWLQSGALQFAISVIGVLVFAGLTAYDTQQIKDNYYAVMGDATATAKAAIMGALNLYLDFINMFVMMLQLFGNRE